MNPAEETERLIRNVPINTSAERDNEILDEVLSALEKSKKVQSAAIQPSIWRIIMKSKASKLAGAIIIIAITISFFIFDRFSSPAWALSETIEALQDFSAVHMVGAIMDEYGSQKECEIWIRANKSGTSSKDIVIHTSDGVIQWVDDGNTYTYNPQNNTVYYENAITAGLTHWPGPIWFEMLGSAENQKSIYSTDPGTGRKHVTLQSSFISSLGPQSYSVKFDVQTKMPIALSQWNNMDRRGAPFFNAVQITYYENLPDSTFTVEYEKDAHLIKKKLTIPESSIGLLSDPKYGILTEELTEEEAARTIVRMLYQAVIDEDLDVIRRLTPACITWNDEFLRYILYGNNPKLRIEEIVEIRPICNQGYSMLGSITAIPVVYKRRDGTKVEDKMIVQFRQIGGKSSCVIHGPYGLPRELE